MEKETLGGNPRVDRFGRRMRSITRNITKQSSKGKTKSTYLLGGSRSAPTHLRKSGEEVILCKKERVAGETEL